MIKHYEGPLGKFDYDDTEFEIVGPFEDIGEHLHYIGKGDKPVAIPEGVLYCDWMFDLCASFDQPVTIPAGVVSCEGMFSGCTSFNRPVAIPEGVKDCRGIFEGCLLLDMEDMERE